MITDAQTNFLYLANTLSIKYPEYYKSLQTVLLDSNIPYSLLPKTKDVWAVDYMPIQITENKFVKFSYNPDYIRDTKKWSKTITDVDKVCETINLHYEISDILLDGGNVVKTSNKVIMCDKVFKENPHYTEKQQLINELEKIFEVDRLIFIPTDPSDIIGHADGIVRFLDDSTVLINEYSKEDKNFQLQLILALHNAGLDHVEIPYNPYGNEKNIQANGIYINYLQMKQAVIVPTFNIAEDERAIKIFEKLFPKVETVGSNDIAKEGGVLNCISWNISFNPFNDTSTMKIEHQCPKHVLFK